MLRAGSETRSEATVGDKEQADIRQVNNSLQVFIDGPFGAPTNSIFHAQHAVLIGTGIGVTPFASILQSIMHRLEMIAVITLQILMMILSVIFNSNITHQQVEMKKCSPASRY